MNGWGQLRNKQGGFTIIELLIVIIIIAILVTLVAVGYGSVTSSANDSAIKSDLTKLADAVKLKALDNQSIPDGGATAALAGDSTKFSGIHFKPNKDSYDLTVANLYYCAGLVNGSKEFGIAIKSKSGKAFSYKSASGISDFAFTGWTAGNNGVALCEALGFDDPFTWSYGYYPDPAYGWFTWAYDGALITNLITNPSMETNVTGWALYTGVSAPTRVTTTPWHGAGRLSAVGNNTSTSPRVYINTPISVVTGDKLALTFRVRSDGQTPTFALVAVKMTSGGSETGVAHTEDITWAPGSDGWSTVSTAFTSPGAGDGLRVSIGLRSATNYTGTMGIDGVMLVKGVDTVPAYSDGSSVNWAWNGAADASTSTGVPK